MGKRSNFPRIEKDLYDTPPEAARPLLRFLNPETKFYEPCVGNSFLKNFLVLSGHNCIGFSDDEIDAKTSLYIWPKINQNFDYFITNPPWSREILHPIIKNLSNQAPTWLLFDADWMHTKQSSELMKRCQKIVSVGRIKWIPGTKMTGKDNCAWYLFVKQKLNNTEFYGR